MRVHGVMSNSVAGPASWNIHNTASATQNTETSSRGVQGKLMVVYSRVALAFFSPQLRH